MIYYKKIKKILFKKVFNTNAMNVAMTEFLKVPHNMVRTGMYWFREVKLNAHLSVCSL